MQGTPHVWFTLSPIVIFYLVLLFVANEQVNEYEEVLAHANWIVCTKDL